MKVQKNIEVWLVKKRLPRPIDLVQYDTGIQLVFAVRDFTIPSGTTGTLYVQKPSGKFVYQETGITVSGNNITIDLENQAITEHGKDVPYQVQLKNGNDLITTFAGIMRVEKSLKDAGATESKSVIAAFEAKTAEQIAAIEAAAQAQIEVIQNLYTTYATKTEAANAVKGNLSGAVVVADDVSPVEHNPVVLVRGKNLFNNAKIETILTNYGSGETIDTGVRVTVTNAGTWRYAMLKVMPTQKLIGKNLTLSFSAVASAMNTPRVAFGFSDSTGNGRIQPAISLEYTDAITITVTKEYASRYEFVAIWLYSNHTGTGNTGDYVDYKNLQVEIGEVATDYEPYTDPSAVTVKRVSKNLIDCELMKSEATLNGVTITRNVDTLTLNGTLTVDSVLFNTHFCHHGGLGDHYTLSCKHIGGTVTGTSSVCVGDSETVDSARQSWANVKMQNNDNSLSYQMTKPFIKDLWFYAMAGVVFNNYIIKIQLEPGKEATDFETCNGAEYTPAADGTVPDLTSLSPNMTILTDTNGAIVECEYNVDTNKALEKAGGAVSEEDIQNAVNAYLAENPVTGGATAEEVARIEALENAGFQTSAQVTAAINSALGVIENGTY